MAKSGNCGREVKQERYSKMKRKRSFILSIVLTILAIFIAYCELIYLVKYEIRCKYNVRPEKICSQYLEKTYGKKFVLIDKIYINKYNDCHVWGFKYKDEEGIEFWEYYDYPYEYFSGSNEWFYNEKEYGENCICDTYWRTVLRYGDEFDLETYEVENEYGTWAYIFPLEDEEKNEQLAQMLSKLYMYTLNNVKKASPQVISCYIRVQDDKYSYSYPISDDWTNLTDEEEVYDFVDGQIKKAWEVWEERVSHRLRFNLR